MITDEKLTWLQQNKRRGDIAAVQKKLNPKNNPNGISLPECGSIINGNLWGKWGKIFTDALEQHITDRAKAEAAEKEKYTSKTT